MAKFRKARNFILNGERYHFTIDELNSPVIVICYNNAKQYMSRGKAILFFAQAMNACDPMSSEFDRYATVLVRLLSCKNNNVILDRDLDHDEDRGSYMNEMLKNITFVYD